VATMGINVNTIDPKVLNATWDLKLLITKSCS
jgi:hypothetical protein